MMSLLGHGGERGRNRSVFELRLLM